MDSGGELAWVPGGRKCGCLRETMLEVGGVAEGSPQEAQSLQVLELRRSLLYPFTEKPRAEAAVGGDLGPPEPWACR